MGVKLFPRGYCDNAAWVHQCSVLIGFPNYRDEGKIR